MKTTGQTRNGLRIRIPANPLQQLTGRGPKTTFWQDFSIADMYGAEAVRDTYNRAFAEWRSNTEYLCEFVFCLNHKIWQHSKAILQSCMTNYGNRRTNGRWIT